MGLTIGNCIETIDWDVFRRSGPVKRNCRGCVHLEKIGSNDTACMYLLHTGHMRGCPVEECDKYEKKKTAALSPQKRNGQRKKNITIKNIAQPADKSQQNAWRATHKEELRAYQKAYYAANKERIAARQKAYRATHKEEARAYQKAYYEESKEKIKAYRATRKEKIREYQKAYRAAHKEELRAYQKAYNERKKREKEEKVNGVPG